MYEALVAENVCKQFGEVKAVDKLNLHVRHGEIYGFLGLNGAGKTTTIRMFLGMIKPSQGNLFIGDKKVEVNMKEYWNKIGYLVEIPYSYPELSVRQNLEISRRFRLIRDKNAVDSVIEKLSLSQYANRKAKNLSLGNSQRLGLAKALIHNPDILILDEPANGLDPAGIFEIRELLSDLAENHGVSILISSHILSEVAKFATRIGIIHEGKMIQEINTEMLDEICNKRLVVNAINKETATQSLQKMGFSYEFNNKGDILIKDFEAIRQPEKVAANLIKNGTKLLKLNVEEDDLETYFLKTIGMHGDIL